MLTHYIFVRRDLPVGILAAMVTHAAGESSSLYTNHGRQGRFRGATAVVLEAENEQDLKILLKFLKLNKVKHVPIIESEGPYAEQLMAVGIMPIQRKLGNKLFAGSKTLKSCLTNETIPTNP